MAEKESEQLLLPKLLALSEFVLEQQFVHPDTEVAISFVDEAEMTRLHLEWMQLDGATDVMSFPMDELKPGSSAELSGPGILGDVVICLPVAAKQAAAAEHSLLAECELLTTHSLLHLLGFDHDSPVAENEMFALQKMLLAKWNSLN